MTQPHPSARYKGALSSAGFRRRGAAAVALLLAQTPSAAHAEGGSIVREMVTLGTALAIGATLALFGVVLLLLFWRRSSERTSGRLSVRFRVVNVSLLVGVGWLVQSAFAEAVVRSLYEFWGAAFPPVHAVWVVAGLEFLVLAAAAFETVPGLSPVGGTRGR